MNKYYAAGFAAAQKKLMTASKAEHATDGKDNVFTDLLNRNREGLDVSVSSLGSNYRYTIRLVDQDIKNRSGESLIKKGQDLWDDNFEPLLKDAGYETKYLIPNIDAIGNDDDGIETLLNLNFMVTHFPDDTSFRSIKSASDDIIVDFDDDLKGIRSDAQNISEHWVKIAWDATPKGSKKEADYFFKIPQFDIEYKCTIIVEKYSEPDAWADGNIWSKWDDNGNGWPSGVNNVDVNGSVTITVGTDNSKHPPYGIEDAATPVEFVITELTKMYRDLWDELAASNAKSIRSVKYVGLKDLNPNNVNVQITNMLNGFSKYLIQVKDIFSGDVGDISKDDLNKLSIWGEKAADDLYDLCAENSDEIVGQVSKDLVSLCRNGLHLVSIPVNKYLSAVREGDTTGADEFGMQDQTLEYIKDVERQIGKVITQLEY